jgi:hypothetical protein
MRGLGAGVDVGAAAPELSRLSVVPSSLGGRVVGPCGARPRGRCVAFGVSVLASVRGLGTGVDVGAVAPELSALSGVPSCSGGSVVGLCGARPWGRCGVFRVLVLASVRGLGIGVDVGAAAPELSALSGVPSCLGGSSVGSCGARPRGWCVALGCTVFASFPYKLAVWAWVCPLTYLCIGFRPVFLINWSLLNTLQTYL